MNKIIKAALFTPGPHGWGLPLLMWGPPGVGKSEIIEGIARSFRLPSEVLSPGERGEGAFGVTPVPIGDKDCVITYPRPDWVRTFEDNDGRGVVFVDELTTAPPALQPALLGLLQARRIGGSKLPKGVRVIGAANPPEMSAGGYDLAAPVANRMGHIDFAAPSAESWTEWLMTASALKVSTNVICDAADEEDRVLQIWDEAYARAKGVVAGFVLAKPAMLHRQPEANDPQSSRAWPSHRTWDMACRSNASSEVHDLDESEMHAFISAFIGSSATVEFVAYAKAMDLPNPADLLDGKVTWKHNPNRLDRTYATLTACTAHMTSKDVAANHPGRLDKMWSVLNTVMADAPDLVIPSAKVLAQQRLTSAKTAQPVLIALNPILKAAGISP